MRSSRKPGCWPAKAAPAPPLKSNYIRCKRTGSVRDSISYYRRCFRRVQVWSTRSYPSGPKVTPSLGTMTMLKGSMTDALVEGAHTAVVQGGQERAGVVAVRPIVRVQMNIILSHLY